MVFLYVNADQLLLTIFGWCEIKYYIIFVEHVNCLNYVVSDFNSTVTNKYHKERQDTEFTS